MGNLKSYIQHKRESVVIFVAYGWATSNGGNAYYSKSKKALRGFPCGPYKTYSKELIRKNITIPKGDEIVEVWEGN